MIQPTQINDNITLRQIAMILSTSIMTSYGMKDYDINNHLSLAKAIENYIRGNIILPEINNNNIEYIKDIFNKFDDMRIKNPNFKLNNDGK